MNILSLTNGWSYTYENIKHANKGQPALPRLNLTVNKETTVSRAIYNEIPKSKHLVNLVERYRATAANILKNNYIDRFSDKMLPSFNQIEVRNKQSSQTLSTQSFDSDGDPTTVHCPTDGPHRCPYTGGGGGGGGGFMPPYTDLPPGGSGWGNGGPDEIGPGDSGNAITDCAGYDADGDGQNDIVPKGIDQMRQLVDGTASNLRDLSLNHLPQIPNSFVEYGAFIVRDPGGGIRMTQPFTSSDSDRIRNGVIRNSLRSLNSGDLVIGFVHTHNNSNLMSSGDLNFNMNRLLPIAQQEGAHVAFSMVNYIVGPDSNVTEYTSRSLTHGNIDTSGKPLEEAINEGSPCS